MANFFDDEADDDRSTHLANQRQRAGVSAGPSRPLSRSRYASDNEDDDNDEALPPPLALRNNGNDKGKGRATSSVPAAAAGGAARHARASSTMSIDVYDNAHPHAHQRADGQRRRRQQSRGGGGAGGFLDDNDGGSGPAAGDNEEDEEDELDGDGGIHNESDIQHLLRLYMDERMAPELLRWNEELIGRLMQNLEAQVCVCSCLCFFFLPPPSHA